MPRPPIASGPQLWRLNREGLLEIRATPGGRIEAGTAHEVIAELSIGAPASRDSEFEPAGESKS